MKRTDAANNSGNNGSLIKLGIRVLETACKELKIGLMDDIRRQTIRITVTEQSFSKETWSL